MDSQDYDVPSDLYVPIWFQDVRKWGVGFIRNGFAIITDSGTFSHLDEAEEYCAKYTRISRSL